MVTEREREREREREGEREIGSGKKSRARVVDGRGPALLAAVVGEVIVPGIAERLRLSVT